MKNWIMALTVLAMSPTLKAEDTGWLCNLQYKGEAQGLQVVAGKFDVQGAGTLNCQSINGVKKSLPILLTAKARPIAAKIALGKYKIYGASANIALLTHKPEDLLGNYYVAEAQGSVIGGAGVIVGTHRNHSDLTIYLSVNALKGFGFNVGLSKMSITLDESRYLVQE